MKWFFLHILLSKIETRYFDLVVCLQFLDVISRERKACEPMVLFPTKHLNYWNFLTFDEVEVKKSSAKKSSVGFELVAHELWI